MFKKCLCLLLSSAILLISFAGCGGSKEFDPTRGITVITREEGSGTRGAFVELLGIEEKDAAGNKLDRTAKTADTTQSTGVMLTSVAQNPYAIGYISLGSLNTSVKALKIDGAEASIENVKNGTYTVSRPFIIATSDSLSEVSQDFIAFILSAEGQQVVQDSGYIAVVEGAPAYSGQRPSGKIRVAGSTSVTPVMEKLKEAYCARNTNAQIEINPSDSSMGVANAIAGICDIGMASRELKDSELSQGIHATQIALDGLAVIVNPLNPLDSLTQAQICSIYIGQVGKWSEFVK
ncbi:MAG: substrate-binding domain-containing protein [Oscillospiraceae bacterium]|jgi:phosphate transport system substrate-binding protein|nr:substrate-binding domain-containing protein [Oscillospiraceae bacterium]